MNIYYQIFVTLSTTTFNFNIFQQKELSLKRIVTIVTTKMFKWELLHHK